MPAQGRKNVHGKTGVRFKAAYTKSKYENMLRNVVSDLLIHGSVKVTKAVSKDVISEADRLVTLTKKEDVELDSAKEEVIQLRQAISRLGNVNLDAPNEYKEVKERFDFMTSQKEDLEKASQQILAAIDEMDKTMISQFTEMFNKINAELDGVFKAMFGGGRASLSMVDPEDVLNTGIDIDVQPPGKMVKNIQTFSGGEKALIAISVLFAILKARTMPLCIFDEVEAALDQANVERFARYLSHYRGQSQFIAVTHRPGTMEQCDTLYGVTMQKDGVSKVLKVQLKDAVHIAKEE